MVIGNNMAIRHLREAGRLGVGEAVTDRMEFPMVSLPEAIEDFTAYGERLTYQHA